MRFNLKQSLNKKHLALFVFLAVVFSFQNCADPLEVEDQDSINSKADKYTFGYETKIDTFSYMSCAGFDNSVFNNKAIFTFKSGAYRANNGIGLNDAFLDAIGNMRASQQENILTEGASNRGAQIQTALRRKGNLLEYYVADPNGEGTEGIDYDNVLSPLDSEGLLKPIVANKGNKLGYFSNLPGLENRRVESYLYFNGSEDLARDLRLRLNNGELIYSLGYVDVDGDHPVVPMSPGEPAEEAYGMGLRAIFAKGHGTNPITGSILNFTGEADARTIYSLREVDLLKPSIELNTSQANWVCPINLRFMIVRPEDNVDVLCGVPTPDTGAQNTTATFLNNGLSEDPNTIPTDVTPDEYAATRNILPVEYWHVDFKRRCVVAKDSADKCYDAANEDKPINYFNGSNSFPTTCGSDEGQTHRCPHYVSVCYRAN